MNQPQNGASPSGGTLTPNDILFTIFRHKWKITIFSLAGIIGANAIWFTHKPLYESDAKLLVRYVTDTKNIIDSGAQDMIRSPDTRGNTVLSSEMEILTSSDSIIKAVESITPQKILAPYGGGTNLNAAARVVAKNLQVDSGKNSSVIDISLSHPNAETAQALLDKLVNNYLKKTVEIHRAGTSYDDLQQQTDSIRTRLTEAEQDLHNQMSKLGIINLEQTKQDLATTMSTLRDKMFATEASIEESKVQIQLRRAPFRQAQAPAEPAGTNTAVEGISAPAKSSTPAEVAANTSLSTNQPPSAADIAQYNSIIQRLAMLHNREAELAVTYAETSTPIKQLRQQIAASEADLKALGIDPSQIPATSLAASSSPNSLTRNVFDLEGANADLQAQLAKYATLSNQYASLYAKATRLSQAENSIRDAQRKKDNLEQEHLIYTKNLEQARADQAIDATKLNNITVIQSPTAAVPATDKKLMKKAGGVLAGGIGFGFALAFLLDLILDPSVKRAKDLESNLNLPVFATIPSFGANGHSKLKLPANTSAVGPVSQPGDLALTSPSSAWMNSEIPPWEDSDPMLPYYEALRDRVVMSYNDDPHKPKIVGLTSCNNGAGVTRLATGLAAALSRDVQRNVLLIALKNNSVAVSGFSKGRPADQLAGFDLPPTNGAAAPAVIANGAHHSTPTDVQEDLQTLVTTGHNRVGASIVQSFTDLMPRLKVSDYDYVIFDLPPISQTGGSIRLASQMERTLLVVEAEETSKDKIKKAKSLLQGSKTRLATVLNKTKSYGPKSLIDEG